MLEEKMKSIFDRYSQWYLNKKYEKQIIQNQCDYEAHKLSDMRKEINYLRQQCIE